MTCSDGHLNEIADGDAPLAETQWRKSSWSAQDGNCVEVAQLAGGNIGVRQSEDSGPGRPTLIFAHEEWDLFLLDINVGKFDFP